MATLEELHAKMQSAYLTGQAQLDDARSEYQARLENGALLDSAGL